MRVQSSIRALMAALALVSCGSGGSVEKPTPDATPPPATTLTSAAPNAEQLLALTNTCAELTTGRYGTDAGAAPTIAVCRLNGAVFWKADMDVDCDGIRTAACNEKTDPAYQDQTSATDSQGGFLDASTLPYVVVPLPSSRFDSRSAGLTLGSVVAVIYGGRLNYGVFGDEGPKNIIGEASYAMAASLGIDPDPAVGGIDSGVTYIAFTGSAGHVAPIEDHAEAVRVGDERARELLRAN